MSNYDPRGRMPWFPPVPPGKQFVLPDPGEYGYHRCIEPTHIFERRPGYCKCGQHFWRQEQAGQSIAIPANPDVRHNK